MPREYSQSLVTVSLDLLCQRGNEPRLTCMADSHPKNSALGRTRLGKTHLLAQSFLIEVEPVDF